MSELDISEVARRSGVPASTLRFYEDRGLIASLGRKGLRRQYHASVLDRLALISLGSSAGFRLDEIAMMLKPGRLVEIDRELLKAKAAELSRMIRQLNALRAGLQHAADCPATDHLECPKFKRLMNSALSGAIAARKKKATPGRVGGHGLGRRG